MYAYDNLLNIAEAEGISVVEKNFKSNLKGLCKGKKIGSDNTPSCSGSGADPSDGYCRAASETENEVSEKVMIMKKEFKVEGMMCNHCRMHVEKALNALDGVKAAVTLEPPVAEVEFTGDKTYSMEELQKQITEEAGEYILSEK